MYPLDNQDAIILSKSLDETAASLGTDGRAWRKLVAPFINNAEGLIADSLKPLGIPKHPFQLARFGLKAATMATAATDSISTAGRNRPK